MVLHEFSGDRAKGVSTKSLCLGALFRPGHFGVDSELGAAENLTCLLPSFCQRQGGIRWLECEAPGATIDPRQDHEGFAPTVADAYAKAWRECVPVIDLAGTAT